MIVSIIVTAFSFALLLYWFRYSCILMLRNFSTESTAAATADSQFCCRQVKEMLRTDAQLDRLERALERDYRLATYLIEHAAGLDLNSIEDRLLVIDYRVMQWYYRLTKSAAPQCARRALDEMADVVAFLAGRLDARASAGSAV
ncbi:MAG TPA: hypothetical protein VLY22_01110 [Candidatus Nitrosotalea sp.]|nr:hypothetical protein [Candidatus Nitrosotalea sp.]